MSEQNGDNIIDSTQSLDENLDYLNKKFDEFADRLKGMYQQDVVSSHEKLNALLEYLHGKIYQFVMVRSVNKKHVFGLTVAEAIMSLATVKYKSNYDGSINVKYLSNSDDVTVSSDKNMINELFLVTFSVILGKRIPDYGWLQYDRLFDRVLVEVSDELNGVADMSKEINSVHVNIKLIKESMIAYAFLQYKDDKAFRYYKKGMINVKGYNLREVDTEEMLLAQINDTGIKPSFIFSVDDIRGEIVFGCTVLMKHDGHPMLTWNVSCILDFAEFIDSFFDNVMKYFYGQRYCEEEESMKENE